MEISQDLQNITFPRLKTTCVFQKHMFIWCDLQQKIKYFLSPKKDLQKIISKLNILFPGAWSDLQPPWSASRLRKAQRLGPSHSLWYCQVQAIMRI